MAGKNYTTIDNLVEKHRQAVSLQYKEAEPILGAPEKIEIKEAVEHKPEEEVRPYIKARAETIELPPDLKRMGVRATPTTKFPSFQDVKLPVSDDKVLVGLHAPVTSSFRWLATLAWYILQKAHLTLKKIHGHVVRVIRK